MEGGQTPRQIAQRIVDDHRMRMISLKPEYDSVDLGEALIKRAIEAALSPTKTLNEG